MFNYVMQVGICIIYFMWDLCDCITLHELILCLKQGLVLKILYIILFYYYYYYETFYTFVLNCLIFDHSTTRKVFDDIFKFILSYFIICKTKHTHRLTTCAKYKMPLQTV